MGRVVTLQGREQPVAVPAGVPWEHPDFNTVTYAAAHAVFAESSTGRVRIEPVLRPGADPLTDGLEVCCVFYRPGPGGCYVCCVVVEGFGE